MILKNRFIFLFFLIFTFLLLYIIIKPSQKQKTAVPTFSRKIERTLKPDSLIKSDTVKGTYRLYAFGDSIFLMSDKGAFIADARLTTIRQLEILPKGSSIYYFEKFADTIAYFDIDKKTLYLKANNFFAKTLSGLPGNALFQNGKFLYSEILKDSVSDQAVIEEWDPFSHKKETKINVNELVKNKINGYTECLSSTLEGNFFKADNKTWGYLFYVGGFFLIKRNDQVLLIPTIDKTPFRKYELREVKMGNLTAYVCKSDNESMINYAAASDGKDLYILSGKILLRPGEQLYAPIDVYDLKNFEYKYTFQAPMPNKNNYTYLMTIANDYLYLFFKDGQLIRYKIKQ